VISDLDPLSHVWYGFITFPNFSRPVGRLIKYTGFGNAAGVLARRGLLAGGGGVARNGDDDGGGEESGESDTEEYARALPSINPVLGCTDPTRQQPSPMAGMSDEQKEYEAIRLVNEIDKLIKCVFHWFFCCC